MQFGKVECCRVGNRGTVNLCVERRLLPTWWLCRNVCALKLYGFLYLQGQLPPCKASNLARSEQGLWLLEMWKKYCHV